MFNLGTGELLIIFLVILLLFGAKRLPELARGLGKGINEFKDAVETGKKSETQSIAAAAGKADLNSVVVAVAEAELTLNTVVAVRNKVIESYREILRMPI